MLVKITAQTLKYLPIQWEKQNRNRQTEENGGIYEAHSRWSWMSWVLEGDNLTEVM